jgi:hypothetical protein
MSLPASEFDVKVIEGAVFGFCYDYPEYCRLDRSFTTRYVPNGDNMDFTVTVKLCVFCGSDGGKQYEEAIANKVKNIVMQASRYTTDFERIKFVHDYLCNTVKYNTASYFGPLNGPDYQLAHCAYGALLNGRAVCDGYANAFVFAMHELGYECGQVIGKSQNQNHAWNIIKVNGEYYYMDVTWDDGDGNGTSYDYFCITREKLLQDHSLTPEYNYPDATSEAMSYFRQIGCEMSSYDYETAAAIIESQKDNKVIYLKFTTKEAYADAMKDFTAITNCIRNITGRRMVKYTDNSAGLTLKFYT